ncbi:hypothetical protein EX30DRAFT_343481 [Ascodesmis nigricans]|uniref:Uncharacterized protein n=1 Tax=Ascodesmis nigricans TaxID=341454 RepID=A0A4S2MLY8_9PEZI|nr:hypothetical protein EX30DRAFT_343481 [Ascodesmis nigricans]
MVVLKNKTIMDSTVVIAVVAVMRNSMAPNKNNQLEKKSNNKTINLKNKKKKNTALPSPPAQPANPPTSSRPPATSRNGVFTGHHP